MKKHVLWGAGIVVVALVCALIFIGLFSGYRNPRLAGSSYEQSSGESNFGVVSQMDADYAADTAATADQASGRNTKSIIVPPAPGDGGVAPEVAVDERLIIKTGNISMVVKDVTEAMQAIANFALTHNGFVVSSNVNEYELGPTGSVTVRIPVATFDTGVGELKKLGEVKSEQIYGQDVTEEYVDLESQLKNLRAAETQFLEIMKRATEIEDVLAVQRELTNVRAQIERIEGRRKFLRESADYSTLTFYLSTDPSQLPILEDDDKWKPIATIKEALRSLLDALRGLGDLIIWAVVYIPVMFVYLLVIWLLYRVGKFVYTKVHTRINK